jgi:hypothetical protein
MNHISIIFIGTGNYINFFNHYYKSHSEFFLPQYPKNFLVFTDQPDDPVFKKDNVKTFKIKHEKWPFVTLNRFKYIYEHHKKFPKADWHFFIDADLMGVNIVSDELINHSLPYVSVQHPGFLNSPGTFETNPISTASVTGKPYKLNIYRQGCFWGGEGEHFLALVEECYSNVEADLTNKFIAEWHDESHLNHFFLKHGKETHTVSPAFAFPEEEGSWTPLVAGLTPIMLHLHKPVAQFPRFAGGKVS